MIVKDFTTNGGHRCAACHREPLFMAFCLCERWYCEAHFHEHYGKCSKVTERTTPRSMPS